MGWVGFIPLISGDITYLRFVGWSTKYRWMSSATNFWSRLSESNKSEAESTSGCWRERSAALSRLGRFEVLRNRGLWRQNYIYIYTDNMINMYIDNMINMIIELSAARCMWYFFGGHPCDEGHPWWFSEGTSRGTSLDGPNLRRSQVTQVTRGAHWSALLTAYIDILQIELWLLESLEVHAMYSPWPTV